MKSLVVKVQVGGKSNCFKEVQIGSLEKAKKVFSFARDKKAKDIVVLELKDLTILTDYFVICSGESTTQVRAIAEYIEEGLSKSGIMPLSIEGMAYSHWVLMDYGDVIVHIFEEETRQYYELEKLWLDAPRIMIDQYLVIGGESNSVVPV